MLKKRYHFISSKRRGEYIFILTNVRAKRHKLKPVDLGDEFGGKLKNVYVLEIEEPFRKINQYKDNVINKALSVYNDLLEDKENVFYKNHETREKLVTKEQ